MRTDRAVLGVLGDLQEGVYQSAQWIVDEIDRRGWVLDSADPVVVVRKFLNKAQKQGRVIYRDLDGRTKGYRLPATTPGDVVDATSPGSVTTQRAGGDNHAEPPATAQDHDPTLSGRNDRDLNRETPERVAIQF